MRCERARAVSWLRRGAAGGGGGGGAEPTSAGRRTLLGVGLEAALVLEREDSSASDEASEGLRRRQSSSEAPATRPAPWVFAEARELDRDDAAARLQHLPATRRVDDLATPSRRAGCSTSTWIGAFSFSIPPRAPQLACSSPFTRPWMSSSASGLGRRRGGVDRQRQEEGSTPRLHRAVRHGRERSPPLLPNCSATLSVEAACARSTIDCTDRAAAEEREVEHRLNLPCRADDGACGRRAVRGAVVPRCASRR